MVPMRGIKVGAAFQELHEFQVHSPVESGGAPPHSKTLARWSRGPKIRQVLDCARRCGALDFPRGCPVVSGILLALLFAAGGLCQSRGAEEQSGRDNTLNLLEGRRRQ